MSIAKKAAAEAVKGLPNISRYALVKKDGMYQPQISAPLTIEMLPKSQVPKSGRVPEEDESWHWKLIAAPWVRFYARNSAPGTMGVRFDDAVYQVDYDKLAQEALSRVDKMEQDLRTFRLLRGSQLALERLLAPKEEQFGPDNDVRYLKPWYRQVRREQEEADMWDAY